MPDEKVAAHRLASLRENLWMSREDAAALIQAGIDPEEWRDAVRDKLAQKFQPAEGKRDG